MRASTAPRANVITFGKFARSAVRPPDLHQGRNVPVDSKAHGDLRVGRDHGGKTHCAEAGIVLSIHALDLNSLRGLLDWFA